MSNAPITLDTVLVTTDDNYETVTVDLPEGSTGTVLAIEDGTVTIEWCYTYGSTPWAMEHYTIDKVDLDDWGVWNYFGYEEAEES